MELTIVYRVASINKYLGFGKAVIQRLKKTSVKRNLYYEIKERVVEETLDNNRINKVNRLCKVYGLNSTKDIRARLIEILDERVFYHKDKFVAPVLHAELCKLEVKKSGKVEHSDNYHDDNLFSYLMALYVWYDGKNLMENFGIHKTTIKTDENEELEDFEDGIEAEKDSNVEILSKDIDEDDAILLEQQQFLESSARIKLGYMYNNELYTNELNLIDMKIKSDPVFRQAYNEKYNTDVSNTGIRSFITLPESVFLDDEDIELQEKNKNGNLSNIFNLM